MEAASIAHPHPHHPPPAHPSPPRQPPPLGMLLFIISEVMIFGAFFTAYFFIRVVAGDPWPAPGQEIPTGPVAVNTAVLISSSFTMHWAQASIRNGNRFGLRAGILSTLLLGITFLFLQVNEYVNLGYAPHDSAQGSIFYGLTGLHGAHVFVGLCLLAIVTIRAFRGHFSSAEHRGVEVPGIYWHFVDIMWVIVYTTVYVL